MEAVKVAKTVNFDCGCMCVYHFAGDLRGEGWKVIPCGYHTHVNMSHCVIAEKAQKEWDKRDVKEVTAHG